MLFLKSILSKNNLKHTSAALKNGVDCVSKEKTFGIKMSPLLQCVRTSISSTHLTMFIGKFGFNKCFHFCVKCQPLNILWQRVSISKEFFVCEPQSVFSLWRRMEISVALFLKFTAVRFVSFSFGMICHFVFIFFAHLAVSLCLIWPQALVC